MSCAASSPPLGDRARGSGSCAGGVAYESLDARTRTRAQVKLVILKLLESFTPAASPFLLGYSRYSSTSGSGSGSAGGPKRTRTRPEPWSRPTARVELPLCVFSSEIPEVCGECLGGFVVGPMAPSSGRGRNKQTNKQTLILKRELMTPTARAGGRLNQH